MKSLKRDEKGRLEVSELPDVDAIEAEHSPIVSETNFPAQVTTPPELPKKKSLGGLMTSVELLEKMRAAGSCNLTTSQFAVLIAPCVKKSVDPIAHHKWDLALSHVRNLLRKLEDEGKVTSSRDPSQKKVHYIYNVV